MWGGSSGEAQLALNETAVFLLAIGGSLLAVLEHIVSGNGPLLFGGYPSAVLVCLPKRREASGLIG